ncbi:Calcium-binding EF-hand [Cynara cardunculus var. scolymus]|uniref:Calcium-binding EF-hand n=1 Tax=Cynara cardunculus var. scolymus TaxID=59895 RepID=A0A118K132_CYNCS|nr:Calcium-binding EF-hand [Cynara cardunculus var. scolymus]
MEIEGWWVVAGRVHYDAAAAHQLLLSDGTSVISDHEEDSFLHDHLKGMGMGMDSSEGNSCHQMYGFLPCSTNLPGHIFLIVIYEFLLYCGESYVSRDALVWGFCTIFGRRKFDYERSKNDHWLRRLLTGSGVVTDSETSLRARFMLVSLMPFIVLLIPMAYGVSFDDQKSVLASSLLVALLCLVYYFFAQHADDSIQKRTLEYAEIERKIEMRVAQLLLEEKISLIKLISGMVRHDLLNNLDEAQRKLAINRIFEEMDRDGSSSIDPSELKHFLETEQKDKPVNEEVVEMIMAHLDVDGNGNIDRKEFDNGLAEWAWEIEQHNSRNHDADKNRRDEEAKGRRDGKSKAIGFVGIGMLMLGFFAEPLTHSVQIFSESISILPFYISFVFLPVATQARTAFAAFGAAKQKRHHTTSSTFSEMYHKVTMNNLMGFALLLCVMIYRELTWHFSAEVLTLVIVCGIVGILTGFNSKFPNWTLIIAFPLYPLSLIFFSHINFYFQ